MLKCLTIFAVLALVTAEKVSYENYRVFRFLPRSTEQLAALQKLQRSSEGYDFWIEPSFTGRNVSLMVAPHKLDEFSQYMKRIGLSYATQIEDVQRLIDSDISISRASKAFDWTSYNTLDQINDWLDSLAKTYPDKVKIIVGGSSYEDRQIKGVKLTFGENNPGVFIEGGIHAREWIAPATATYIINELLTSEDPDIREMADRHNWFIFPSINPDGYAYSHEENRLWRRTRTPYTILSSCYGADANRNWGYKWMGGGSSILPCSETYAGPKVFSEIETKSLSEYITSVADQFYAYISFHSYSQLLLIPYGDTKEHLDNYNTTYPIGLKAAEALERRYGTKYTVGNIAETIYIATGSSTDWVKATHGTPLVYTYELRDEGLHGFLLPTEQIIPTAKETIDSLVALFKEAQKRGL